METFLLVLAVIGTGVYALYAHHLDKLDAAARAELATHPETNDAADRDAA